MPVSFCDYSQGTNNPNIYRPIILSKYYSYNKQEISRGSNLIRITNELDKRIFTKNPIKNQFEKMINKQFYHLRRSIYIYIFRSDSKSNSTSKFRNKEKQKFCTVKIIRQFVFTIRFWKINIQPVSNRPILLQQTGGHRN